MHKSNLSVLCISPFCFQNTKPSPLPRPLLLKSTFSIFYQKLSEQLAFANPEIFTFWKKIALKSDDSKVISSLSRAFCGDKWDQTVDFSNTICSAASFPLRKWQFYLQNHQFPQLTARCFWNILVCCPSCCPKELDNTTIQQDTSTIQVCSALLHLQKGTIRLCTSFKYLSNKLH